MTAHPVAQTPQQEPAGEIRHRAAWLVWGIGALCYFVALFHRASLGVVAPEALERFGTGPAVLAVFSALQLGVYLVLQVPSGLLADRMGPRRVITWGMLALAVGSGVFAISGSVAGGIAGRVLIGFGDAFMFTNVLRLAALWFPPRMFGKVAAITGLAGGLGQIVSTTPLSASLHGLGWVPTFLGAGALTALVALVAWAVIRDRPGAAPEPQQESAPTEPISSTLREVVSRRGTRHSFWVHFVLMAQFLAVTTLWGAPWLTESQGHPRDEVGSLLLVAVLAFVAGSWLAGQYVAGRHLRRQRFSLALSVLTVVAWAVLILWPGALPMPLLLAVLIVIGLAGGAAMLAFDGARAANEAHRSGAATGVVNMGGFTAAVLIQLLVGLVLQLVADLPGEQAYRWAFLPVLALLILGTGAQFRLRHRHPVRERSAVGRAAR